MSFHPRWWPDFENVNSTPLAVEPYIAVPVEEKPDSELVWPDQQKERFFNQASSVVGALVIGWRASEDHFLRLMKLSDLPLSMPIWMACRGGWEEASRKLSVHGFTGSQALRPDPEAHADRSATFSELMMHGGFSALPVAEMLG